MARNLILLRHGDTGVGERFVGRSDIPVCDQSLSQLRKTRTLLQKFEIDAVFCSPLLRCRQTAEYIDCGRNISLHDDLQEIDFGAWEMKSFTEIAQNWPEKVNEWSTWSEDFTFPQGEKIGDFIERLRRAKALVDGSDGDNLLIISHGGVIRHLICLYLKLPVHNYLLFNVKPGKCTMLSLHSDGGVLTAMNI